MGARIRPTGPNNEGALSISPRFRVDTGWNVQVASGNRLALRGGKGREPDMVVRGTVNTKTLNTAFVRVSPNCSLCKIPKQCLAGLPTKGRMDYELDEQQKGFLDMFR
jgi:hypothetical protein